MNFISHLLGIPLGLLMWAIFSVIKNYGVAIAVFTLVIRLILVPISVSQQKSTASIAAIQPKLDKLKKQYANNPNKMQEEQMKLYQEENINPMASCLPMLFQLIFLYGVFDVVYRPLTHVLRIGSETITALTEAAAPLFEGNSYFNSRPELYILQAVNEHPEAFSGIGISQDILAKVIDFSQNNKLFGVIDLGAIPDVVFQTNISQWTPALWGLFLIPIATGVIQLAMTIYSTYKQKKLNPEASSQMGGMNIMLYGMSIFFIYITFKSPAGLGFYWICSSLVGFLQTFILNKIYTPEYVAKLIEKDKLKNKNKKRSAFMEKYNEMLQEQLKQNGNAGSRPSPNVRRDSETGEDIKLSKSQMKDYERKIIAEARRRQAEKYGDEYSEDD